MTTTTVRERPILFAPRLVRAILDGNKSVTRRVVRQAFPPDKFEKSAVLGMFTCPFGDEGDRLWVRETWQHEANGCDDHRCGQPTHIFYRATEVAPETMTWRPSIFMPRWASRLALVVTKVRAERLHSITEEECVREGVTPEAHAIKIAAIKGGRFEGKPHRAQFVHGWTKIHLAREHYQWDANPWVWVIDFRVLA